MPFEPEKDANGRYITAQEIMVSAVSVEGGHLFRDSDQSASVATEEQKGNSNDWEILDAEDKFDGNDNKLLFKHNLHEPRNNPILIAQAEILKKAATVGTAATVAIGATESDGQVDMDIDDGKIRDRSDERSAIDSYNPCAGRNLSEIYGKRGRYICRNEKFEFVGKPIPLPVGYDLKTKIFKVIPKTFCSLGCLKRYIIDHKGSLSLPYNRMLNLFSLMTVMIYKIKGPIVAAPTLDRLAVHRIDGKGYTIAEYRSKSLCSIFVDIVDPHFIYEPVNVMVECLISKEDVEQKTSKVAVFNHLPRKRSSMLPLESKNHSISLNDASTTTISSVPVTEMTTTTMKKAGYDVFPTKCPEANGDFKKATNLLSRFRSETFGA